MASSATRVRPGPGGATTVRRPGFVRGRLAAAGWFLLPFAVIVLVWYVAVEVTGVPRRFFPQVTDVWAAARRLLIDGALFAHIWASVQRVFRGVVAAVATAVPFGLLMGANRYVAGYFTPLLRFSVALAGIAWIPLATLWFGFGEGALTFIIWNAVFFALTYYTMLGVSRIPPELRRAAQVLGAPRWRLVTDVLIPGALPSIVTGLRVGIGYGWRGLIAAEIIATNVGLGYSLFLAQRYFRTDIIILSMIVIGVLWLIIDRLALAPLERRTIERWGQVWGGRE